ncbi:hypothetical protein E3J79_03395 [Candidatus Dependentiae bacterium]|nr:MAG: hypothetical protein E3J79_03395 [Candidatus Dependentiae bacterium]
MPKHLMLLVSLILLVLVPGCGWCKKKETKRPAKPRPAKKVKMEPIKLSDLYDFEEEDVFVAEADEDNYIRKEEEEKIPQKF